MAGFRINLILIFKSFVQLSIWIETLVCITVKIRNEKMPVLISAVVCTYNRINSLKKTVNSLLSQSLPKEEYEIIVVDGGSSDDTKNIITAMECDQIRFLEDFRPGLSYARNTGYINAKGKYVAYLDDDAIAKSDWLENIIKCFNVCDSCTGCIGGKTEPIWENEPPKWLSTKLYPYLSLKDISSERMMLPDNDYLVGTNMIFPKYLLMELGGFSSLLGRNNNLISGEEVLFQKVLISRGYKCVYDPAIQILHYIPASRLTKKWFLNRMYSEGLSAAIFVTINIGGDETIKMSQKNFMKRHLNLMLKLPFLLLCAILPSSNSNFFFNKCTLYSMLGFVCGYMKLLLNKC